MVGRTPDSYEIEFKGGRKALFENPRNIPFLVGDYAIVDIDRGADIGIVVREGQDSSGKLKEKGIRGPILRRATGKDLAHLAELREKEADAHRVCQQLIAKQNLPMKLVDVEWQFDGNKIRFYFTSDHRVDFRKLVRDLAGAFKTRIEMRQIGVRDEARRLGGYGRCGRYYCCRGVIQDFDPVTLKMVKEQHLAPGSPKISGGCGRLMCCLRYERGFYAEAGREYPKVGTKVTLQGGGRGRVVAVDIFRGRVSVSDEEGKTLAVSIANFKKGRISESDSEDPSPDDDLHESVFPDDEERAASSGRGRRRKGSDGK
jgi:cell fate regulator YaaT (PSP1 superfamily)